MNLEFIQGLWDKDSVIDDELLHSESTKTPALHAKYYKIFTNILTLQKAQETQYKILKKEKWIYYSGKASPEVYKAGISTSSITLTSDGLWKAEYSLYLI